MIEDSRGPPSPQKEYALAFLEQASGSQPSSAYGPVARTSGSATGFAPRSEGRPSAVVQLTFSHRRQMREAELENASLRKQLNDIIQHFHGREQWWQTNVIYVGSK